MGVSFGGLVTDSVILIVTTSVAVIFGVLVLVWRRSSDRTNEVRPLVVPRLSLNEDEDEVEVGSGKTKVSVFYGTQTGTAEGFAKVDSATKKPFFFFPFVIIMV